MAWLWVYFFNSPYTGHCPPEYNRDDWEDQCQNFDYEPHLLPLGIFDMFRQNAICIYDIVTCIYIFIGVYYKT